MTSCLPSPKEFKTTFEQLPKAVFVMKILNNPIAD